MQSELIKEMITASEETASGATQLMVDGDIIVPDRNPDILKIVQVDAEAVITDKEVSENRIALSGRMELKIMYIPDKENERLKSIITSFGFEHRIDKQGIDLMSEAVLEAEAERVEYRLLNSRKLRVKSICRIDYTVTRASETEVVTGAPEECEVKKRILSARNSMPAAEREFTLKESVELASGKPSAAEILKVDVNISDREYKPLTGKLVAKGTVCICVLYTSADGRVDFAEARVPFTEVFELEGMSEDAVCDTDYYVTECYYDLRGDSDGDMRIVDIQLSVSARIRPQTITELEIIEDIYVPGKLSKTEFEKKRIEEVRLLPGRQSTVREIIPVPKNAPAISAVYNVMTETYVKSADIQGGKLSVEGGIEAYVLYICDSEENPIYSMKKNIPFSVSLDCPSEALNGNAAVKVRAEHTGFNLTASNEVELRCILGIDAEIVSVYDTMLLISCTEEDIPQEDKKGIVVYFVQNSDTLWDISKRYRVSEKELAEFNGIEGGCVSAGERLIIPAV